MGCCESRNPDAGALVTAPTTPLLGLHATVSDASTPGSQLAGRLDKEVAIASLPLFRGLELMDLKALCKGCSVIKRFNKRNVNSSHHPRSVAAYASYSVPRGIGVEVGFGVDESSTLFVLSNQTLINPSKLISPEALKIALERLEAPRSASEKKAMSEGNVLKGVPSENAPRSEPTQASRLTAAVSVGAIRESPPRRLLSGGSFHGAGAFHGTGSFHGGTSSFHNMHSSSIASSSSPSSPVLPQHRVSSGGGGRLSFSTPPSSRPASKDSTRKGSLESFGSEEGDSPFAEVAAGNVSDAELIKALERKSSVESPPPRRRSLIFGGRSHAQETQEAKKSSAHPIDFTRAVLGRSINCAPRGAGLIIPRAAVVSLVSKSPSFASFYATKFASRIATADPDNLSKIGAVQDMVRGVRERGGTPLQSDESWRDASVRVKNKIYSLIAMACEFERVDVGDVLSPDSLWLPCDCRVVLSVKSGNVDLEGIPWLNESVLKVEDDAVPPVYAITKAGVALRLRKTHFEAIRQSLVSILPTIDISTHSQPQLARKSWTEVVKKRPRAEKAGSFRSAPVEDDKLLSFDDFSAFEKNMPSNVLQVFRAASFTKKFQNSEVIKADNFFCLVCRGTVCKENLSAASQSPFSEATHDAATNETTRAKRSFFNEEEALRSILLSGDDIELGAPKSWDDEISRRRIKAESRARKLRHLALDQELVFSAASEETVVLHLPLTLLTQYLHADKSIAADFEIRCLGHKASFASVLWHPVAVDYFREFLKTQFAAENLDFWLESEIFAKSIDPAVSCSRGDVRFPIASQRSSRALLDESHLTEVAAAMEARRRDANAALAALFTEAGGPDPVPLISDPNTLRDEVTRLIAKYVSNDAPYQINIVSSTRAALTDVQGTYDVSLFDSARREVYKIMKHDSFPRFINSEMFERALSEVAAPTPKSEPVAESPRSSESRYRRSTNLLHRLAITRAAATARDEPSAKIRAVVET